jgi:hypothetical protein
MKLNRVFGILFAVVASLSVTQAGGFKDDFANARHSTRQALRGDWKYRNNAATCVSDPELYKKFANHGPILRWPCEFTDGTVEFEFQPKGCSRIVITLNEDGHVFRISINDEQRTRIFGWIGKSSKTNKAKTIAKDGVPTVSDVDGKWIKGKLVCQGEQGEITLGDYTAKLKHHSLGRKKGEFTISFAGGTCAVSKVSVTPAAK